MEDLILNLRNIKEAFPDIDITFEMLYSDAPDMIAWLETQGEFEFLQELKDNGLKNI